MRAAFSVLERGAPAAGAALAERLWFTVGARPAREVRERRGVAGGTVFAVPVGGSEVRGVSFGDPSGPTAYLVHGWGGWWQQLSSFVPGLLARGYRVVAFDALAHGDSGPGAIGRRSSSVPEMADAYRAVVDRFGEPALTVAHSMGSLSVLWAQRHHDVVPARQVLVAPATTVGGMLDLFSSELALGPAVRAGLPDRFRRRIGRELEDFELLQLVETELRQGPLPPALIVHDSDDAVTSAQDSARLAEAWPGSRLLVTQGLGHSRVLRDPAVLAEAERFLDATERVSPSTLVEPRPLVEPLPLVE
ncbi:alpha/beta fold hydrolase [Agrococcus sp. DT81.2]|uniref:alpha/beta fold hydrolase n=1 Tax=Agrococcus sp. DT81.2 TaxID=3393414 RepID=UPI003CE4B0B1